jgi:septal ring factor EnvC (AmiA/AmiB activator)
MRSTIQARLHSPAAPTGKRAAVKRFFRAKGKDAARVSVDQEEIKKLGDQLDRAIEDFGVRTLTTQNLLCVRANDIYQVRSSIRVELVVDDVRALSVRLSKRIQEMNQEIAKQIEEMNRETLRTSMNGMLFFTP